MNFQQDKNDKLNSLKYKNSLRSHLQRTPSRKLRQVFLPKYRFSEMKSFGEARKNKAWALDLPDTDEYKEFLTETRIYVDNMDSARKKSGREKLYTTAWWWQNITIPTDFRTYPMDPMVSVAGWKQFRSLLDFDDK